MSRLFLVAPGFLLIFGLFFARSVNAQFEDAVAVVAQANRAYASGDFETAITLYEGLIQDGAGSATLYFNLATTYDEAGQTGLALLNYRRVQQQNPRDAGLSLRISEIQSNRQNVQVEETVVVDRLGTIVSPYMTTTELATLGFMIWLTWFAIGTYSVMRMSSRVALRPVLIVVGVVVLAIVVLLGTRVYVESYRPVAVVIAPRIPVFSGPNLEYLELYSLSEAAELRVVRQEGNWLRIILPDGRQGWLQREGVEFVNS